MVLFRNRAVRAAVLSLVTGIFAGAANASQARFTLPFETHWGSAVLPPGEYTMASPLRTSWPRVLAVSGEGRTVYILASVESALPESEESSLEVVNVRGARFVREFRSGLRGKSFSFDVPKAMRTQIAHGTADQATKVAVLTRH